MTAPIVAQGTTTSTGAPAVDVTRPPADQGDGGDRTAKHGTGSRQQFADSAATVAQTWSVVAPESLSTSKSRRRRAVAMSCVLATAIAP